MSLWHEWSRLTCTAVAAPHRAMADDEYRGYTIPKGCMIMPNIWYEA